jgi:hypothetical protein
MKFRYKLNHFENTQLGCSAQHVDRWAHYHELYDRCGLDRHDLLRIGEIFIELNILEQSASMTLDTFQGNLLLKGLCHEAA